MCVYDLVYDLYSQYLYMTMYVILTVQSMPVYDMYVKPQSMALYDVYRNPQSMPVYDMYAILAVQSMPVYNMYVVLAIDVCTCHVPLCV